MAGRNETKGLRIAALLNVIDLPFKWQPAKSAYLGNTLVRTGL